MKRIPQSRYGVVAHLAMAGSAGITEWFPDMDDAGAFGPGCEKKSLYAAERDAGSNTERESEAASRRLGTYRSFRQLGRLQRVAVMVDRNRYGRDSSAAIDDCRQRSGKGQSRSCTQDISNTTPNGEMK
jgi:hypothetical protein